MTFRVGIDIGGTFTDFTVVDDGGGVTLWKEDSTPEDPVQAIERGLAAVADTLHCGLDEFLARHGSFRAWFNHRNQCRHTTQRPTDRPTVYRRFSRHHPLT